MPQATPPPSPQLPLLPQQLLFSTIRAVVSHPLWAQPTLHLPTLVHLLRVLLQGQASLCSAHLRLQFRLRLIPGVMDFRARRLWRLPLLLRLQLHLW